MWYFQVKLVSNIIPQNYTQLSGLIFFLVNFITTGCTSFVCGEQNTTKLVLLIFSDKQFASSHFRTFFSSRFMIFCNWVRS